MGGGCNYLIASKNLFSFEKKIPLFLRGVSSQRDDGVLLHGVRQSGLKELKQRPEHNPTEKNIH